MSHTPVQDRPHPMGSGKQMVYRFPNGRGASVVRFPGSYTNGDEWKVAVVKFDGPNWDDFHLDYTTPLTDDVIGHVKPSELDALLDKIAALPEITP